MNIKIITRHGPSNYGSLLQSIATIKIIERLGHKCEIIDYQRDDERGMKAIVAALHKKEEWNNNLMKKLLYIAIRYPIEFNAQRKFDRMRKSYLTMTPRYSSLDELKTLKADIFMTGSDQVWGPVLTQKYDEAYFLGFAGIKAKKVAYAASFGKTDFNSDIILQYKEMLSRYDAIAVREDSAVELLNRWNINCLGQVLDPTLMLTGNEWENYIKKDIKGKYVLVYQLHNNHVLSEYAKRFAEHTGLPLMRVSPSFHQIRRGGKFIYLPDLADFLSYIKNATYFITDSFHGTAFALNFNKQFVEVLPNNSTGSRNQSILKLTGLSDRIVTDYNDFTLAEKTIDYKKVNAVLDEERVKSMRILNNLCQTKFV